jgi:metal-responsive CopG/Arc/MetJ family transcriptional regulator
MSVKAVQISVDPDLLARIDADPEARRKGRSAFIRSAVRLYLTAKERKDLEAQIHQAYSGEADALLHEIEDLIGDQAWPND